MSTKQRNLHCYKLSYGFTDLLPVSKSARNREAAMDIVCRPDLGTTDFQFEFKQLSGQYAWYPKPVQRFVKWGRITRL